MGHLLKMQIPVPENKYYLYAYLSLKTSALRDVSQTVGHDLLGQEIKLMGHDQQQICVNEIKKHMYVFNRTHCR